MLATGPELRVLAIVAPSLPQSQASMTPDHVSLNVSAPPCALAKCSALSCNVASPSSAHRLATWHFEDLR